ncbi:hypothetical protein IJ103_00940 [Candidatus Saccharibacteria bacterium]|nr:hypothetical protein [Candidatus Saccharibacteria bacterium]
MKTLNLVLEKLAGGLSAEVALDNMPTDLATLMPMDLIRAGAEPARVMRLMSNTSILSNPEELLEYGISALEIAGRVKRIGRTEDLKLLDQAGVPKSQLIEKLDDEMILTNLSWFYKNGYTDYLDLDRLVERCSIADVWQHRHSLLLAGADVEKVMERFGSIRVASNLDLFFNAGATAPMVYKALAPYERLKYYWSLTLLGLEIDPNQELGRVSGEIGNIDEVNLETLLSYGVDPLKLAKHLSENAVIMRLPIFARYWRGHSASLQRVFRSEAIIQNLEKIKAAGFSITRAELEQAISRVESFEVAVNFSSLMDAGESFSFLMAHITQHVLDTQLTDVAGYEFLSAEEKAEILERVSARVIVRNLRFLEEHNFKIDIQKVCSGLNFSEREAHLEELYARKADLNLKEMVKSFSTWQINRYFTLLVEAGVEPDYLVDQASSLIVRESLEKLLEAGANPNLIALKILDAMGEDEKKILLAHGATLWLT